MLKLEVLMTLVQLESGRMAKKKNICIVVYNDDINDLKFVIDVLSRTFGYHSTQAHQCANMINNNGSYVVKILPEKDMDIAETYNDQLVLNGLSAKIISM